MVWIAFSYYFRRDLTGLQHVITVTVAVAVFETLLWACYFTYYNYHGLSLIGANWVGAFLGALKMTSLKTMLLLVSTGYSITRPNLPQGAIIVISILTLFYFLIDASNEYIFVGRYIGLDIPAVADYLSTAMLSAVNIIYVVWIAYSLNVNMVYLRHQRQFEKLSLYKIFAVAMLIFVSLGALCFILQVAFSLAKFHDNMWSFWWVWNAYWELSYLALTLVVAYLWRPNENNLRYAFSAQIPQEEEKPKTKDKSRHGDELSGDVQLQGEGTTSDEAEQSDNTDDSAGGDALENLVL